MIYDKDSYQFEWSRIGDIAEGRQNLGEEMPVAVYRLMQYTITDVLIMEFGEEKASSLIRQAGFYAGSALAESLLDMSVDFDTFVANLQRALRDLKVGILRIEKADLEKLELVLTVSEDLDCSGLPVTGETVCTYDEGFIAGILQSYTGKTFTVREIDCWASGDRTCRFTAKTSNI